MIETVASGQHRGGDEPEQRPFDPVHLSVAELIGLGRQRGDHLLVRGVEAAAPWSSSVSPTSFMSTSAAASRRITAAASAVD